MYMLKLFTWIAVTGCSRIAARALGGRGSFEGDAAALGFVYSLPMLVTWIPETIAGVLYTTGSFTPADWIALTHRPGFWKLFSAVYQWIWLAWQVVLAVLGMCSVERLPVLRASAAALAGLVPFLVLMAVFVR